MKTKKRQIEFDLQVIEIGTKEIKFLAICNYGEAKFTCDYPYALDSLMITSAECNNFNYLLDDTSTLSEIETWVDATNIAGISKDIAEACINRSINGKHFVFQIHTNDECRVTVVETENGVVLDKYEASKYDDIELLIITLRHGK